MNRYIVPAFISVLLFMAKSDEIKATEGLESPEFVIINQIGTSGDSVYEDVLSYSERSFGDDYGRPTNVHETVHGINSRERNRFFRNIGDCNVFYCMKGRIVVIREPKLSMSDIKIPETLRSYRYNLYFKEQLKYWNDTPTYPLDEWSAYIAGAECAIEDHERGIKQAETDAVSGCLEFSIYALATAKTIKELDPEYWERENNFKKLIAFNLARSEKAFFQGRIRFKSDKQEKLLSNFRETEDAEEIRSFMKQEFGNFFIRVETRNS